MSKFYEFVDNVIKYVNELRKQIHSRKRRLDSVGSGGGFAKQNRGRLIFVCAAEKLKGLLVQGRWMFSTGVCAGILQCALHSISKGSGHGLARAGKETRRFVCRMWVRDGGKRRLGALSAALQDRALVDLERCRHTNPWRQVLRLWRCFSSQRLRLSPFAGQGRLSIADVLEQVSPGSRKRAVKVRSFVRELSSLGA